MSRFNKVHVICERLRGKPCQKCPAWYQDPQYGRCQRGCYGLAKELMNIAVHGNPWGAERGRRMSDAGGTASQNTVRVESKQDLK